MIHHIHLEDHKNINNNPFAFLSLEEKVYSRELQNAQGNRIRSSQWQSIFSQTGLGFEVFYEWSRLDKELPEIIDSSISYENENDLRTSHIGIYGEKTN